MSYKIKMVGRVIINNIEYKINNTQHKCVSDTPFFSCRDNYLALFQQLDVCCGFTGQLNDTLAQSLSKLLLPVTKSLSGD